MRNEFGRLILHGGLPEGMNVCTSTHLDHGAEIERGREGSRKRLPHHGYSPDNWKKRTEGFGDLEGLHCAKVS